MAFGPHEIVSIVFLVVFLLLTPPSVYLWIKYIRAGYSWRYGFYGATLCCVTRIAAFISELVFYSEHKDYAKNPQPQYFYNGALIAYTICLSIGFIGLIDCESSLFTSWAEKNLSLNRFQEQFSGKIRLLNLAALVILIIASVKRSSTNADGTPDVSDQQLGATLTKVGIVLFLVLTLIQVAFLAYGWLRVQRRSETLIILSIAMTALLVRIIFSTYSVFHPSTSVFYIFDPKTGKVDNDDIKYLVGPFLVMEVIALLLMIGIGLNNVKQEGFANKKKTVRNVERGEPQEYEHVMASRRSG